LLTSEDFHIQLIIDVELEGADTLQFGLSVMIALNDFFLKFLLLIDTTSLGVLAFRCHLHLLVMLSLRLLVLLLDEALACLNQGAGTLTPGCHGGVLGCAWLVATLTTCVSVVVGV